MNLQDKDKIAEQAGRYFIKLIYSFCSLFLLYLMFSVAERTFDTLVWSNNGLDQFKILASIIVITIVIKKE